MVRGRCPIRSGMTIALPAFQHIINNPLNVQGDDGPAAFVGLKDKAVVGVVVEEILREGCGIEGIFEDQEVYFLIGIDVRIAFT